MLNKQSLIQFTGTSTWTRWSPLFPNLVLTDGALHVAEKGGTHGAFWLMDAIASYQPDLLKKFDWAASMQVWHLKKVGEASAVLKCISPDEGEGSPFVAVSQDIEYTDFDLDEIELWVMPGHDGYFVIMLPSEY